MYSRYARSDSLITRWPSKKEKRKILFLSSSSDSSLRFPLFYLLGPSLPLSCRLLGNSSGLLSVSRVGHKVHSSGGSGGGWPSSLNNLDALHTVRSRVYGIVMESGVETGISLFIMTGHFHTEVAHVWHTDSVSV